MNMYVFLVCVFLVYSILHYAIIRIENVLSKEIRIKEEQLSLAVRIGYFRGVMDVTGNRFESNTSEAEITCLLLEAENEVTEFLENNSSYKDKKYNQG